MFVFYVSTEAGFSRTWLVLLVGDRGVLREGSAGTDTETVSQLLLLRLRRSSDSEAASGLHRQGITDGYLRPSR